MRSNRNSARLPSEASRVALESGGVHFDRGHASAIDAELPHSMTIETANAGEVLAARRALAAVARKFRSGM